MEEDRGLSPLISSACFRALQISWLAKLEAIRWFELLGGEGIGMLG